jgi:uncharacterized damage-inducible protein DinB
MPHPRAVSASKPGQEVAQAFLVSDRMTQLLLERLDSRAWRAKLPGQNVRTIADIVVHVHNIRCKWLRLSAPHLKRPPVLDRHTCTIKDARTALAKSAHLCAEMLEQALGSPRRVQRFVRDGWAQPWPPGVAMSAYMITHEAHHRGQACMLVHQLGFRIPNALTAEMWNWERLYKQCGFDLATAKVRIPKTKVLRDDKEAK